MKRKKALPASQRGRREEEGVESQGFGSQGIRCTHIGGGGLCLGLDPYTDVHFLGSKGSLPQEEEDAKQSDQRSVSPERWLWGSLPGPPALQSSMLLSDKRTDENCCQQP